MLMKLTPDEGMPPCKPMERHKFLKAFHTAETNTFVMGGMARFHLLIHKARTFKYEFLKVSFPIRISFLELLP
jgi:hypothetical protein